MIFPRRAILLGSCGEAFSPLDLPGDWLLLPASAYTAGSWPDQGGNGFDFSQATGDNQPSAQVVGGVPVVRFDGVNDVLLRAAVLGAADVEGTLFIVAAHGAGTGSMNLLSVSDDASNSRRVLAGKYSNVYNNAPWITQRNSDTKDELVGATGINDNVMRLLCFKSTGSAYTIYLDGVAESLTVIGGANNGDWMGDCTGLDVTAIGAYYYGSYTNYFAGDIAYIAYVNRALSDAERQQMEVFLAEQCGLGF